jgi:hypothetical protein
MIEAGGAEHEEVASRQPQGMCAPTGNGMHGRATSVPAQSLGDVKRRPRREDGRARPRGSIEAEARKPRRVLPRVLLF